MEKFQSPLGEVVKETELKISVKMVKNISFQSPLGEVVKETSLFENRPNQGSYTFQSPLGEVVKETIRPGSLTQKGFQASNRRTIFYLSIRP